SAFLGQTVSLSSISPASGSAAGGASLTLTGSGFEAGATVSIGGAPCTSVVVANAERITCVAPAGSAGPADVTVTSAGRTATLPSAFTYVSGPVVSSISPTGGPLAGGASITINGSGFVSPPTVDIGGNVC